MWEHREMKVMSETQYIRGGYEKQWPSVCLKPSLIERVSNSESDVHLRRAHDCTPAITQLLHWTTLKQPWANNLYMSVRYCIRPGLYTYYLILYFSLFSSLFILKLIFVPKNALLYALMLCYALCSNCTDIRLIDHNIALIQHVFNT